MIVKVDAATEGALRTHLRTGVPADTGRRTKNPVRVITDRQLRDLISALHANATRAPSADKPALVRHGKAKTDANTLYMNHLKAQEAKNRQHDVKAGRLITSEQLAQRLGITKQSVARAVSAKRMFSVSGPGGVNVFPAFYADHAGRRRQLERVTQALGDLPGSSKWEFFTTARASLDGETPIEALSNGRIEPVLRSAAGFLGR